MSLLNLGPNFVPATKRIPFMEIILPTETCAIDLKNSSKEIDAKLLRQKVSHNLNKNLYIKLRDNQSVKTTKKGASANEEQQRHNNLSIR